MFLRLRVGLEFLTRSVSEAESPVRLRAGLVLASFRHPSPKRKRRKPVKQSLAHLSSSMKRSFQACQPGQISSKPIYSNGSRATVIVRDENL